MKKTVKNEFRRKREGRTNYKKRLRYLLSGSARLVIRTGTNNISIQLVNYNEGGDKVIVTTTAQEIKKLGWKAHTGNLPAAYLTGFLHGKKLAKLEVSSAIVDIGFHPSIKAGRIYSCIAGLIDAGIKINVGKDMLPSKTQMRGESIASYAQKLKTNAEEYNKRFSRCIKRGIAPEELPTHFDEIKSKIA